MSGSERKKTTPTRPFNYVGTPRIGGMSWTAWVGKDLGDDGRANGTYQVDGKEVTRMNKAIMKLDTLHSCLVSGGSC